ncbi:MAG: hypothetical protein H7321_00745 [Bacteroidia bacterium]|nr:hypothetical protein [Bacteroidia bacterium]
MKGLIILFFSLLFLVIGLNYVLPYLQKPSSISIEDRRSGLDMVEKNYGHQIDSCAALFEISPAYLKALAMLECGGRKIFEHRFEPHVYEKLKKVKSGQLDNYENVTTAMLADASDDALKNLASSWGPFQLMGYKCTLLNINVKDIRGEDAVYWGTKWISLSYGNYLKKKEYRHAFHIHNAGSPFPLIGKARTHAPDYVPRGIKYMAYYGENIAK